MDYHFASFARTCAPVELDMLEPSLSYVPLYQCMLADPEHQLDATLAVLFESDYAPFAVPLSTAIATVPLSYTAPPAVFHNNSAVVPQPEVSLPCSPAPVPSGDDDVAAAAHFNAGSTSSASSSSDTPPPPSKASRRRGRPRPRPLVTYTTKEPLERNYGCREDFDAAWQRWRQLRDLNNAAVRRSRESKRKRFDDEPSETAGESNGEAAMEVAVVDGAAVADVVGNAASEPAAAVAPTPTPAPTPAAAASGEVKCNAACDASGCDGCQTLVSSMREHRRHVALLVKALRSESELTEVERQEYEALMAQHD